MMMAETTQPPHRRSVARAFVKFREAGIILFIVLLAIVVSLRNPTFLSIGNFRNILISMAILVMREGRLTGHFSRAEASQETLMAAATTAA